MAIIEFKDELSSAKANATFLLKTEDDTVIGVISLENGANPNKYLTDLQGHLYTVGQILGIVGENDPNALIYVNENYISNGDNRKVAIEKLDAQVKINADTNDTQDITLTDHESRISTNETEIQAIEDSVGVANGIAPLGPDTKIDAIYLPSYVDDVEEYADLASFPATGETGKIYVAIDTGIIYRWSGSVYIDISTSPVDSVNGQTGVVVLTKVDVGLGNVTDDAQLKRSGGDFNTFTEKVAPVADDILLIENSENAFEKQYIKISSMSGGGGSVPTGVILPFGGPIANIPEGFLLCDGSLLDRTTFSVLFDVIGTGWGTSSASDFRLPTTQGLLLRGSANGSGFDPDRNSRTAIQTGSNTGDNVGSYQSNRFGSHNHGGGNHTHSLRYRSNANGGGNADFSSSAGFANTISGGTFMVSNPNASRSTMVNSSGTIISTQGGNQTVGNNVTVNFIIKY